MSRGGGAPDRHHHRAGSLTRELACAGGRVMDDDLAGVAVGDEKPVPIINLHPERCAARLAGDQHASRTGEQISTVDGTIAHRPRVEGASSADRDALRLEPVREPDLLAFRACGR